MTPSRPKRHSPRWPLRLLPFLKRHQHWRRLCRGRSRKYSSPLWLSKLVRLCIGPGRGTHAFHLGSSRMWRDRMKILRRPAGQKSESTLSPLVEQTTLWLCGPSEHGGSMRFSRCSPLRRAIWNSSSPHCCRTQYLVSARIWTRSIRSSLTSGVMLNSNSYSPPRG